MRRRSIVLAVLACCTVALITWSVSATEVGAAVESGPALTDGACVPWGQSVDRDGVPDFVPVFGCNISICVTVQDCIDACPNEPNPACVNSACQYGGGGGGGGGGTQCNTAVCASAYECYQACPEATYAYCSIDSVCVYP